MKSDELIRTILSIWGAILSTILAIITIIKFRGESKEILIVLAAVDTPFEELRVEVCNKNKKPATIKEIEIGIGVFQNNQIELVKIKYDQPIKLGESDIHFKKIERLEILKAVKLKKVEQKEFQRLWVKLILSTGRKINEPIYINPSIIEGEYYRKAEQYMATDLFLGFEKMDSKAYPDVIK